MSNPTTTSTGLKNTNVAIFSAEVLSALKATKELQDNVHQLLETFTSWNSQESDASLNRVRDTIKDIQSCHSKLEKTASNFSKLPDTQPVALGNCGLISLDPGEDKSSIYKDLLHAYSWVSKLNADASSALKSLKRKYPEPERFPFDNSKKFKDSRRFLEVICPILQAKNQDLAINIADQKIPCLKVTIKGVMCALIVFTGGCLDRVIIRNVSEDIRKNDCLDLWSPSKYLTFRKITDVSQAALLNFYSPTENERAAKAFVNWLSQYSGLYSDKCQQCRKHLKVETKEGHLLPPCWRDTITNKPYHITCR